MSVRLAGLSEIIYGAVPPALVPLFVVLTTLGGTAFLTGGLAVLYLGGPDRRRAARVVGYAVVASATVVALKGLFALPRPPEALHLVGAEGYGFPSGHALGSTVVYGAVALEFGRRWDRRLVAAGTAALVAAISLSRVVLGVHYLGDVLAGAAVGLVVVWLLHRHAPADPRAGFAAGLAVAVLALATTGGGPDAWGATGASLGGLVAVTAVWPFPEGGSRRRGAVLGVVGVVAVGGLYLAAEALPALPVIAGLDEFVLVAVVLALPAVAGRVRVGELLPG